MSAEEKLAVVLDGLKDRPVKEICRKYGISDNQYYKWREEALNEMKGSLQDKRRKQYRDQSWEVERNRLLKMIGGQQPIIDIQKNFRGSLNVAERRARVRRLVEEEKVPVRIALKALFLSRSMYHHKPRDSEDGRGRSMRYCGNRVEYSCR